MYPSDGIRDWIRRKKIRCIQRKRFAKLVRRTYTDEEYSAFMEIVAIERATIMLAWRLFGVFSLTILLVLLWMVWGTDISVVLKPFVWILGLFTEAVSFSVRVE